MKPANKKEKIAYLGSIAFHIMLFFLVAFSGLLTIHEKNSHIIEVELIGGGGGAPKSESQEQGGKSLSVFKQLIQKVVPPDSILQHVENAPNIVKETEPTPKDNHSNNNTNTKSSNHNHLDNTGNNGDSHEDNGKNGGNNKDSNLGGHDKNSSDREIPVQRARIIKRVEPDYPDRTRIIGKPGHFQVRFYVNETGDVENVEIVSCDTDDSFKKAAVKALYKWKFEPARNKYGQPVPSYNNLPLTFEFN